MGLYINETSKGGVGTSAKAKVDAIVFDGGFIIPEPKEFVENLVCVVNNGPFGAAAYANNERELKSFQIESDTRPKTWILWDKVKLYAQ